MFIVNEETGDIKLHQGDSGEYIVTDLPPDKLGEKIYFEIQDSKRKKIGEDIESVIEEGYTTTFKFTPVLTDLLKVKLSEETAEYYGGIKICTSDGNEETIKVANKEDGERIIITVLPKEAEGE